MYVSGFTAFCMRQNTKRKNQLKERETRRIISCPLFQLQHSTLIQFVEKLTDAHHITVDVLKVRRWFWCCAIPTTVAKLMLAFFLTHFGAVHNCLKSKEQTKWLKRVALNNFLFFFFFFSALFCQCKVLCELNVEIIFCVQFQLTANTRGLRAHIRRCSLDRCSAFLQMSSWLWCKSAFGSNNPTFCSACNPKSLRKKRQK